LVKEKNRRKKKWIYLSSFKKRRKIVSRDNSSSFVSSDFTYEDLEAVHADEYECGGIKKGIVKGEPVYIFEAKKKDQESTAYSKLIFKVSLQTHIAREIDMYDKNGEFVKRLTTDRIRKVQNIWTPFITKMEDLKGRSHTILSLKKIKYNLRLPRDTFTTRNMEK
jgi:outer membrane lipoprotein-sorting protein